jgi:hypothetical protein
MYFRVYGRRRRNNKEEIVSFLAKIDKKGTDQT